MATSTTTSTSAASSQVQIPQALSQLVGNYWVFSEMDTDLPSNFLQGFVYAIISEDTPPTPVSNNVSVINSNEPWRVDIYWYLVGGLTNMITGKWAVRLFMESLGADDLDFELTDDQGLIDLNPCAFYNYSVYHASFSVPANRVRTEATGTPFQPVLTITYLTPCKINPRLPDNDPRAYRPGPIGGVVSFPITQFYREGVEI